MECTINSTLQAVGGTRNDKKGVWVRDDQLRDQAYGDHQKSGMWAPEEKE